MGVDAQKRIMGKKEGAALPGAQGKTDTIEGIAVGHPPIEGPPAVLGRFGNRIHRRGASQPRAFQSQPLHSLLIAMRRSISPGSVGLLKYWRAQSRPCIR